MATMKLNPGQRTFDSLGSVPSMPEGYYSGDQPNPNLRKFVMAKYLKKFVVRAIHLHEFHPTTTKVEKGDIESVVGEFRKFLENAVDGDGKGHRLASPSSLGSSPP